MDGSQRVLYHHTSAEHAEAILRDGLLVAKDCTGLGAVFLSDTPRPEEGELLAIRIDGLPLEPDFTADVEGEQWYCTFQDVPPQRIRRVGGRGSRERACTRTPAFIKWFADSQVTRSLMAGDVPRLVYHATDADFRVFEFTEDIGFHFGSRKAAAGRVAAFDDAMSYPGIPEGVNVMPAFLKARKLLRLPDLHLWEPKNVVAALHGAGVLTDEQTDAAWDAEIGREWTRDALAAHGYDGIVYKNETERGGDSFIVFDPRQIKSALGCVGFDPVNPDIIK